MKHASRHFSKTCAPSRRPRRSSRTSPLRTTPSLCSRRSAGSTPRSSTQARSSSRWPSTCWLSASNPLLMRRARSKSSTSPSCCRSTMSSAWLSCASRTRSPFTLPTSKLRWRSAGRSLTSTLTTKQNSQQGNAEVEARGKRGTERGDVGNRKLLCDRSQSFSLRGGLPSSEAPHGGPRSLMAAQTHHSRPAAHRRARGAAVARR
mmetsp:Transcript_11813/g.28184  ORF Transcript_11813/g.28184 Transcript_11813/m.28184 type:complete len:205 (-) Transcript_11813:71-685(-)